jgi:hypothetical protein
VAPLKPGTASNTPVMSARIIGSTLFVVTVGSLLHFMWDWSGRSSVVAVFAATNESTWEHLKLAFWPALFLSPLQRLVYSAAPGWLVGTAIRCLLPPLLIVALFYGYTAILGTNHLAFDLGTFVVSVSAGEMVGHRVMKRPAASSVRLGAAAALLAATVAFSTLSFRPPSFFLFDDPQEQRHRTPSAARGVAGAVVD